MKGSWRSLIFPVVLYAGLVGFVDPLAVLGLAVVALAGLGIGALVGLPALVIAWRAKEPLGPIGRVFRGVGLLAGFVLLTVALNRGIMTLRVAQAKAYPARVAPQLEAFREKHGAYPEELSEIPELPFQPLMFSWSYLSTGESYSFRFSVPGGMIDTWNFDSEEPGWYRDD